MKVKKKRYLNNVSVWPFSQIYNMPFVVPQHNRFPFGSKDVETIF